MRGSAAAVLWVALVAAAACTEEFASEQSSAPMDASAPQREDAAAPQEAGSDSEGADAGHDDATTQRLPISDLRVTPNPSNVLAYEVRFASPVPGIGSLDIACDGLAPWTLEGKAEATEHGFFVMGLIAEATCELTADMKNASVIPASSKIAVPTLPADLPQVELSVPSSGQAEPGWTLLNLSLPQGGLPYTVAMIDLSGRYRWYYEYPGASAGSDTPVRRFGAGVLIGGRELDMTEVSWQGRQLWVGPRGHHEVTPSYEPGRVYYLTDESACNGQKNGAAGLVEYDYLAARETRRWYMCDHYVPEQDVPDWSHLNAIAQFHDGRSLLLSSRSQSSLLKLDWPTGDIVWSLGLDGQHDAPASTGDFEMGPADLFYHQHDPEVLESGNILLYDNGVEPTRPYSRAVEIAYEWNPVGTSRARVVWEFRHEPDIYTPLFGDADRLEGGNTLVTFGGTVGGQTHITEVRPDGTLAWEIRFPTGWRTYRSERVPDTFLGFPL